MGRGEGKGKAPYKLTKTKLEAAKAAFGLASSPYAVKLEAGFDELQEIQIPLDRKLCNKLEVNPATIRVFRWDEKVERFELVEGSGIDERWQSARARIFEPGIYVAAGANSNPWVGGAVSTLRTFGPLLHNADLEPIIRHRLCPVILCPGFLGGVFEEIGEPGQHGLPPLPPGGICEICTGGGLGHAVDLWPEPVGPMRRCGSCNLNDYLRCNPRIRRFIIWQGASALRYDSWTAAQKSDLASAFNTIRTGGEVGLPETAPTVAPVAGALHTQMTPTVAWEAYIAHLAHTLVVDSCGWVDWSIRSYTDQELRLLLHSESMFVRDAAGNYLMNTYPQGRASHGDPTRVYNWLRSEGLVASHHDTTIGRVLEWCRDNMSHYLGGPNPDNMQAHWQYRGFPPVERIIAGTTSPHGSRHWTAGCWGTSGFLRLVLRTINVPSTMVSHCGHSQPFFPTIDSYLSHGDDPYNRNSVDAVAAGTDLLVDADTFEDWFDEDDPDHCDNIGRRPRELIEG